MASLNKAVEQEQREPLNPQTDTSPGPSQLQAAETAVPDPVTGTADVLTMEEFRGKVSAPAVSHDGTLEAESAEPKVKGGFGGSWKCAAVLTVSMIIAVIFIIVLAVLSSTGKLSPTSPADGSRSDEKSSVYREAAVVTDVGTCSEMGRDILKKDGSAVDAAITAQLCIGLVNSQSSGLGGGFFMVIYYQANRTSQYLNARETAPSAVNDAYVAHQIASGSPYGLNKTAVPGEVRGLWDAHQRYGKLPWAELLTPVIELAESGYRATQHLAATLERMTTDKTLSEYPGAWDIYMRPDGSPKREGDLVQNLALANTLRALAANGSEEFYTGVTANKMVEEIQSLGGIITAEDFAGYATEWANTLTNTFGDDYTLLAPSMPSGGPVVQFIINVMQAFNLTSADFISTSARVRTYHRFLEALKFAYGLRSHLGDSETPEVMKAFNALTSLEHARDVAASIRDDAVTHTNASYYQVAPDVLTSLGGTSHVSVLAANGDAVSSTTSVNYRFGSRVRSAATGIIYNNHMGDFSLSATSPNYVAPGKRPLSSMSGLIVLDKNGRVKLVEGSAGSSRIININAWIILSTLLGKVPLSQAIDERRLHSSVSSTIYSDKESGFPQDILRDLTALGHTFSETRSLSIVQAILRQDDDKILAYSDPRKGGKPSGY